jgi:hypothetical protein
MRKKKERKKRKIDGRKKERRKKERKKSPVNSKYLHSTLDEGKKESFKRE